MIDCQKSHDLLKFRPILLFLYVQILLRKKHAYIHSIYLGSADSLFLWDLEFKFLASFSSCCQWGKMWYFTQFRTFIHFFGPVGRYGEFFLYWCQSMKVWMETALQPGIGVKHGDFCWHIIEQILLRGNPRAISRNTLSEHDEVMART